MTKSVLGARTDHVADVDVVQPFAPGDPAGPLEGFFGSRREILHLELGVKPREMQGSLAAQVLDQPAA